MATPQASPQKTPLTPASGNQGDRPSYQRPTASQKLRETPPKKAQGQAFIPSPSPNRSSAYPGRVRAPNPVGNGTLEQIRRKSRTLPLRSRRPAAASSSSKLSAQTLHFKHGAPGRLESHRKPAADYSGDDSPLNMHNTRDAPCERCDAKFVDDSENSNGVESSSEQHYYHQMSSARRCHQQSADSEDAINAITARFRNLDSDQMPIPLQTEDCVPDCIKGSLGGLSRAEFFFVHDGFDLLHNVERSLILLRRDSSLTTEGVQRLAGDAMEPFQKLVRKYTALTEIAPLRQDYPLNVHQQMRADIERTIKQESEQVIKSVTEQFKSALQSDQTKQMQLDSCRKAQQEAQDAVRTRNEEALVLQINIQSQQLRQYEANLAALSEQVHQGQHKQHMMAKQFDQILVAKDSKIAALEHDKHTANCNQSDLLEEVSQLNQTLSLTEDAKAVIIDKLFKLQSECKQTVDKGIRTGPEIMKKKKHDSHQDEAGMAGHSRFSTETVDVSLSSTYSNPKNPVYEQLRSFQSGDGPRSRSIFDQSTDILKSSAPSNDKSGIQHSRMQTQSSRSDLQDAIRREFAIFESVKEADAVRRARYEKSVSMMPPSGLSTDGGDTANEADDESLPM